MKKLLLCVALGYCATTAALAVTPLWMRDVKISPDGEQIAFTYKGDIYKVSSKGGTAVRLTSQPTTYESAPVWSPDGKQIAFASDRYGGSDVFVMSADGGTPVRLTFNGAKETPVAFTPDGKNVIFTASIQAPASTAQFPTTRLSQLYSVPTKGGRAVQILGTAAESVSFLPDGQSFVYQDIKGFEDTWRKHHISSVTRDIWLYNAPQNSHTNLSAHPGEDLNPVISPDGTTVYMLSERNGGSMNVYSFPVANPQQVTPLTSFTRHPVRFLSRAADNGTLAYTYDGEIYTQQPDGKPRKLDITLTYDDIDPVSDFSASNVSDVAVSPDGKQVAYISRGEVFVTATEYPSVKQITHTPEGESDLCWGADGRELYYTSERSGHYNIYRAKIARKDDPNFSNATLITEEPVIDNNDIDRTMPSISPDGKTMVFSADRTRLMALDLKTGQVRDLADASIIQPHRNKGMHVVWSPDSKWIALEYINLHHDPYSDIAVIDMKSGKMHKITESGYFNQNPRWAMDGKALLYDSERYGMRNHASWGSLYDVMMVFLDDDAYQKYKLSEEDYALLKEVEDAREKAAKKAKEEKDSKNKKAKKDKKKGSKNNDQKEAKPDWVPDFNGLDKRTVRLTPNSSDIADGLTTSDGATLYYLSAVEGGYDLWKRDLRKGDVSLVKKLDAGHMAMTMDKNGVMYLLGRSPKRFDPKGEKFKSISLGGTLKMDRSKEREYMLRHVFNEVNERFYVKDLNGVDWKGYYEDYAKFLPHIANNYDYATLLSELLGELNVSHSGGRYYPRGAKEPTASLGLLYDLTFAGPGMKVEEIVADGPFDRSNTAMLPGSVITAINGVQLTDSVGTDEILNGLRGKKTLVEFTLPSGKSASEVVLPISTGAMNSLMYDRWIKQREADVERLSNGRLGYLHLASMSDDSFREIYDKLLGKYVDKEGIVIDTRWNGGGRLHEDIEVLFSGKTYLTQEIHGVETTVMPSRRWNKPSIMVIGEANYSNAHGTPWVYKHCNLGSLVGMPVPGTMSSVNWETLQDPTLVYGMPVIGFRTAQGNYLENTQLEPDIKVANDPATLVKGEDTQLKVAVETLLKQIDTLK